MTTTRKVLVYPERTWEFIGAVRWDVSTELVKPSSIGSQDIDPDIDIEYVHVPKTTWDGAVKTAKRLVKHQRIAFGAVRVQKQIVDWLCEEDHVAEWIDVGDSEEFSSGS